ncbi:ATP-binding cassette domain-containing protein [Streptomyces sp. NPDC059009]|uniref:ATP-binding cassette domain-containing protein n=1 Tax=Streptomyces sp. NPDC059009 TaxID=3346694 RepID=UPI0036828F07
MRFLWARRWVVAQLAFWSVLETGQTFLTGYALARALDEGFLAGREQTGLGWLGAAALGVLAAAYGTGRVYRAVARLVEPLRDALARRVVARGLRDADGAAVSRLTQQVEIARDTFAGLVMVSRSFVFTAAGALIGLFKLSPALLLIVVPPLFAGLLLFALTLAPLARRQEEFLIADEELAARLGEVCPGLRDVTAAGAEEQTATALNASIATEARTARTLARWGVLRLLALTVGGQLPIVLLLVTAPWLLDHQVTPGDLAGALAYLTQALLPALHNLVHGLGAGGSRLVIVLRRLTADTSSRRPELPNSRSEPAPSETGAPTPAVRLTSVTFAYGPRAEPVVRDLDLTVARGEHLAVVGPSGVGKSTLAGLVAGLLVPGAGSVRVEGREARSADAVGRRVLIPQEAYVFSGTLGDNLRYLRAERDPLPDGELEAAAELIGAGDLVRRLGGLEGSVEPGELSAGERQLIALTRAYVSRAALVLLDEATCHLDPVAEARAERAFAARPGSTLVVIAHRISSARRAGRVLVMDGPRTLCGRHGELIERSPLYRDLAGNWSPQATAAVSHPALPLGYPYGVDPVARPGLPGDRGHVVAHRPVGQMEPARDVRDRRTPGGE